MIAINALWPLLLPVAAFSGWAIGRNKETSKRKRHSLSFSRDYFVGLNYLLNEQEDKALDVFMQLLEVDGDTVETHMALGSLFRRRGEVHRAIRVHQNLIARPQLDNQQRVNALLELGRDYMNAGVYDRAERIFHEVVGMDCGQVTTALRYLLDIYQRQKSWSQSVEVARKLESLSAEPMHAVISHCYCQLAEQSLVNNDDEQAKRYLKRAANIDRHSVRASILQGKWEMRRQRYKPAIKSFMQVIEQDPDFISEIIQPLAFCYQQLGNDEEYVYFLERTLRSYPRVSLVLAIAAWKKDKQGIDAAADFVAEQLSKTPSLRGLHQLVEWHLHTTEGKVKAKLEVLQKLMQQLLTDKPIYRCKSCGFSAQTLNWHCPGCKQWNTIKPIHGLEGD